MCHDNAAMMIGYPYSPSIPPAARGRGAARSPAQADARPRRQAPGREDVLERQLHGYVFVSRRSSQPSEQPAMPRLTRPHIVPCVSGGQGCCDRKAAVECHTRTLFCHCTALTTDMVPIPLHRNALRARRRSRLCGAFAKGRSRQGVLAVDGAIGPVLCLWPGRSCGLNKIV
jgi:hypothetical protein